MKQVTINTYKFAELSDKAKETAMEHYRNNTFEYFWGDDAIKSLEKFAEHFNCELSDYSIEWFEGHRNNVRFSVPEYMENLKANELKQYIKSMGSYNAKTKKGLGDCKFTGYCMDESACDGARIAFFKGERDINEILQAGYESWYEDCNKDAEYQISDEAITEHFEENEYNFTEDGTIY